MAKTAAQRQAEYRARKAQAGGVDQAERVIHAWVSSRAMQALGRMAQHEGVTQKALLERVLIEREEGFLSQMSDTEAARYLSVT